MPIKPTAIHLIADMKEFLKKRQEGGTLIRKMKIFTLADDVAMRKGNGKDAESIKEISRGKRTATKYNKIKDDSMQQERQRKTSKKIDIE